MADIKEIFQNIYSINGWGSRESKSGLGSEINYTKTLRSILPILFSHLRIRSLLDAPCGDFHWMKFVMVDLDINYLGCDIVRELIQSNTEKYETKNIKFDLLDVTTDNLPKVDLWMCKNCLFHFSNDDIWKVIKNFQKSNIPYFFTTRIITPIHYANQDIETGDWRPLDPIRHPFNFDPEPVFRVVDYIENFPRREMCVWTKDQLSNILIP